jgi:hypothetical protein
MMRIATVMTAAALLLAVAGGSNAQTTCKAQSAEKKLAGAAQTSFLKKCETDAKKKCETDETSQKLKGAAKTSHVKKCTTDAVGT